MKIILDNIQYSKIKQGGVSNYWYELSKYLLEKNKDVFFYESDKPNFNCHRKLLEIPESKIILDTKKYYSSLAERLSTVKIDDKEPFIFHSSYYRTLANHKYGKEVTTVHDFIHNFHSTVVKRYTHNYLKYKSIQNSTGIICISQNTYNDLMRFCPPKKNQKVTIIHNGVSDDFHVLDENESKNSLPIGIEKDQYILYIGARQKYKNFDFATSVLNQSLSLKLIVVGDSLSAKEKAKFGKNIDRVQVLTHIDNMTLNVLYNNALAFIYPSNYEGFGIPIIEAMKAGCPVIAINSSSIPEVSGDAAILLDQLNVSEVKKNLLKLNIPSEREIIIAKGLEQSKKFSWEKCCKETADFYDEIF